MGKHQGGKEMTKKEKKKLIDEFNHESMVLGTKEENPPSFTWSLAKLMDAMMQEKFSVVFRPVETSDGQAWVEAQEV